jgi:hypothetical protein
MVKSRLVRGQVNKVAGRTPPVSLSVRLCELTRCRSSCFPSSRILSRPSLGGLRSSVHEHWQLFPNFEQLTSVRCLTIFKVLTPPLPLSSFQSVRKHTSFGFICTNTFTNVVCSVVPACPLRVCRNSLFISFLQLRAALCG